MFTLVTVLDYIPDGTGSTILWPSFLALLPALTHVRMRAKRILASCKRLETLVLNPTGQENLPFIDDHRFVYVVTENYREDWVTGTQGGTDFWAIADAVVAKNGEAKSPSSFPSFAVLES
ncbi:hypothetical protein B0H13DRAFT_1881616 [Mycena leptocephala]|nr:hypothetical protein B0H13DRAFT_1881616 [Mycena leptocephala]